MTRPQDLVSRRGQPLDREEEELLRKVLDREASSRPHSFLKSWPARRREKGRVAGPCGPGQTAAQTGCTPATGEGGGGGRRPDTPEGGGGDRPGKEPFQSAAPTGGGGPGDTMAQFTDAQGHWSPERVAEVHRPLLEGMRKGVRKAPGGKPILFMTGGGYGSGKSTLLDKFPGAVGFPAHPEDAIRADPDALKAGIPEYRERASGPNPDVGAASYVHEESSAIAKQGVDGGLRDGYHVIYDSSGDTGIDKLHNKVAGYRAAGATRVEAHYAFPGSVLEAQRRADSRAAKAAGGLRRFVPPAVLAANHAEVARCWLGAARRGTFDRLGLWSTAGEFGQPPALIAEAVGGKIRVVDAKQFEEFKRIGGAA